MLSESEAAVQRIRQHKNDSDCDDEVSDDDGDVQEWEESRRREAFARWEVK